jgi:hypothetical protein
MNYYENLKNIIAIAMFDDHNINIYTNPNDINAKIISARRVFIELKFLKKRRKSSLFTEVTIDNPAEFIVYLDHPLTKQTLMGNIFRLFPLVLLSESLEDLKVLKIN